MECLAASSFVLPNVRAVRKPTRSSLDRIPSAVCETAGEIPDTSFWRDLSMALLLETSFDFQQCAKRPLYLNFFERNNYAIHLGQSSSQKELSPRISLAKQADFKESPYALVVFQLSFILVLLSRIYYCP